MQQLWLLTKIDKANQSAKNKSFLSQVTQTKHLKTETITGTFILKTLRSVSSLFVRKSYFLTHTEACITLSLLGLFMALKLEESTWCDLGAIPLFVICIHGSSSTKHVKLRVCFPALPSSSGIRLMAYVEPLTTA